MWNLFVIICLVAVKLNLNFKLNSGTSYAYVVKTNQKHLIPEPWQSLTFNVLFQLIVNCV